MFVHWTSGCLFWTSGCQVEAVAERVKVGYTGQCKYISPFSVAPCVPGVTCGQQLQMGSLSYPHDWMPFNWRGMQKSLKTFCFIFCWLSGSNPTSGRLSEHTLIWTSTTEEKWVNMYYYYAGRGYSGNPDKTLESVSEKSGNIFFFFTNLFNVWLEQKIQDSHIYFCIQSVCQITYHVSSELKYL